MKRVDFVPWAIYKIRLSRGRVVAIICNYSLDERVVKKVEDKVCQAQFQ